MKDRIEKSIELNAPLPRVWRALTDYREFGDWFRVKLEGPFVLGEVSRGVITHPGYEHLKWAAKVQAMDTEQLFSFTWRPCSDDPEIDDAHQPETLVEFRLQSTTNGTHLVVSESGFSALPDDRRTEVFRRNEGGWAEQVLNIQAHVES